MTRLQGRHQTATGRYRSSRISRCRCRRPQRWCRRIDYLVFPASRLLFFRPPAPSYFYLHTFWQWRRLIARIGTSGPSVGRNKEPAGWLLPALTVATIFNHFTILHCSIGSFIAVDCCCRQRAPLLECQWMPSDRYLPDHRWLPSKNQVNQMDISWIYGRSNSYINQTT